MTTSALGQRIATIRSRRRITQEALAEAAGVSVDLVRKLEQGRRKSARLDTITQIANALDAPIAELIGKPAGLAIDAQGQEIHAIRRAIVGVYDPPDPRPANVADMWQLYWTGRYGALSRMLPAELALTRAAAANGGRTAHATHAEVLQIAASLLSHLAYEDLAHVALMQAVMAAEQADDPTLRGAQLATRTWILARQGLWQDAERLSLATADEVEPRMSTATPDQLAVWGECLRYGCTAMARAGRGTEAREILRQINTAAVAIDGRRPQLAGMRPFGPIIAGMAAVGIAVATDEPRQALRLAGQVGDISQAPLAVRARYLLNVAYAQMSDWQSLAAVETLRQVERLAPELMPQQTIARAIIGELLTRRGRLPGLRSIATRAGVSTRT